MVLITPYVAEEIFLHKEVKETGDIIELRIFRVPCTEDNPEGISYSCVYIHNGIRLIGYDNFEGHKKEGMRHHKHIKGRMSLYEFVDEWKLIADFNDDVEKIKQGVIP